MRRSTPWLLLVALLLFCALLGRLAHPARAESKHYYWDYILVDLSIRPNGDLEIVETQRFVFQGDPFSYAYREISQSRLTGIDGIQLDWLGHPSGLAYARTWQVEDKVHINWSFPRVANSAQTFRLRYVVHGATRIYEARDEVWWAAIGGERDASVNGSLVTVHLPAPVRAKDLVATAYGAKASVTIADPQTVVFRSGKIGSSQPLEIRVQFPHGLVRATPPPWQAQYDRQVAYDGSLHPGVTLLTEAFSVLVLVIGCLSALAWHYVRGRNRVAPVAPYLSEPPSDLAPGLAGVLLDQRVEMPHVVATLIDLARRGVVDMRESGCAVHGGGSSEYLFRLLREPPDLRRYEAEILSWFFPGGQRERWLSSLWNKFYAALPEIERQMSAEAVQAGFFPNSPEEGFWSGLGAGIGMTALGLVGSILCALIFEAYTDVACLPPLALAGVGVLMAVLSTTRPRWTPRGAEDASRWQAFRRYLQQIEQYADLAAAKGIFDRYLPYAVAFGLDQAWIGKFARVDAPAPAWYIPHPLAVASGAAASLARSSAIGSVAPRLGPAAAPSLGGMSTGLATSLQGMSAGLASMLNSASTVLGSSPMPVMRMPLGWRVLFRIVGGASGRGGGGAG